MNPTIRLIALGAVAAMPVWGASAHDHWPIHDTGKEAAAECRERRAADTDYDYHFAKVRGVHNPDYYRLFLCFSVEGEAGAVAELCGNEAIHGVVDVDDDKLVECADLPDPPVRLIQECGEADVRAFVERRISGVSGLQIDPLGSGPIYRVSFALDGLACAGTAVTGQACDDPDHFDLWCGPPVGP